MVLRRKLTSSELDKLRRDRPALPYTMESLIAIKNMLLTHIDHVDLISKKSREIYVSQKNSNLADIGILKALTKKCKKENTALRLQLDAYAEAAGPFASILCEVDKTDKVAHTGDTLYGYNGAELKVSDLRRLINLLQTGGMTIA